MTTSITPFLEKYEAYLGSFHPYISSELWPYYKEHGCLPPLSKEDALHHKLIKGGWDKEKILTDCASGILSKEDFLTFLKHGILDADALEEKLGDLATSIGWLGDSTEDEEKLFYFLDDWATAKDEC